MKQRFIRIVSSVAAVLLLAVGLIWLCHADPIEAFGYFCYGLFGSLNGFAEIFVKATPLILMGLGVSISFQTGFFNIGAVFILGDIILLNKLFYGFNINYARRGFKLFFKPYAPCFKG